MQMAPPLLKVDSILRSRLECVSTQARDPKCTCHFSVQLMSEGGRYRENMTVYIYYNPTTPPSGQPGQRPLNERKHNFGILQGTLRLRKAYGEWWMIMIDIEWDGSMLWWTFSHVIIPYQYVSINLPTRSPKKNEYIQIGTVRWSSKISNKN